MPVDKAGNCMLCVFVILHIIGLNYEQESNKAELTEMLVLYPHPADHE